MIMNLRTILAALSLDILVASAADTSATVTALANTLHIMMDLSSLTADAAIDIFPSTADRFLSDVIGGFELITTAADNEALALSVSKETVEGAIDASMQKDVCENYHAFADVYRILMEIVIGKTDTLTMVSLNATTTAPDTPGQLEDRLDGCNRAITSLTQLTLPLVPDCATSIVDDQGRYNETTKELKSVLQ